MFGVVTAVGNAAFGVWLDDAGYSQPALAFSSLVVGLESVGWRRAAGFTARYKPMGPMLAFLIAGALATLGWSALESFRRMNDNMIQKKQ